MAPAGWRASSKGFKRASVLACNRRIIIKRRRSRPGHGKCKVDGAHAVIKQYIRMLMAQQDDSEAAGGPGMKLLLEAASSVNGESRSLASEVNRRCVADLTHGVQGGMNSKRQRLAKMDHREFTLVTEQAVKASDIDVGELKTVDPSTADERHHKMPHRGVKGYHEVTLDPQLGENEAMLRRIPCYCPSCGAREAKPTPAGRYAHNPACVLEPIMCGLNDHRKVTFVAKRDGDGDGDGDEGDDDEDAVELQEMTDELVADVEADDYLLIDAGGDKKAAGAKVDGEQRRYYAARTVSPPYEVERDDDSGDYPLRQGDYAIDIEYLFLVNAPATTPRRYHSRRAAPCLATVPTHLVLHARFDMATVQVASGASSQLRQAAALGDVVELGEEDHAAAMEELAHRAE